MAKQSSMLAANHHFLIFEALRGRVCRICQYLLVVVSLNAVTLGWAFSAKDVNTAAGAFNTTFYYVNGTNGYFKNNLTDFSSAYFWNQAEMIETVIDAYEWSSNSV